jgi:hypothetical protein
MALDGRRAKVVSDEAKNVWSYTPIRPQDDVLHEAQGN